MKTRTVLTPLAVAVLVSLLLVQMVIVGEARSVSKGKPPTRTPRSSGSSGCGQVPPIAPGVTETQYVMYDGLQELIVNHHIADLQIENCEDHKCYMLHLLLSSFR